MIGKEFNIGNIREFKSVLFSMLMQNPSYALQVYNALNGSDYTDPNEVVIYNLRDGVSLLRRNDAAFIVRMQHLNVYEHQSTANPNMPLRDIFYFSSMMERFIKDMKKDLLSRKLQKIPTPHFVVFYNGDKNEPEYKKLSLSDAYEDKVENPDLELVCHVYNINRGNNENLMTRCPVLEEYMTFVEKVKLYAEREINLKYAVNRCIDECIEEGVLSEFLEKNRNEVESMIRVDGTQEEHEEFIRQEALEEGRLEGRLEGIESGTQTLIQSMYKKGMSIEQIKDITEKDDEYILDIIRKTTL